MLRDEGLPPVNHESLQYSGPYTQVFLSFPNLHQF